ncbi:hypothetical protein [Caballeronia sp. Sq4a]|uniref:hypothetical protein n=1 Tax=Caballeronia sp. Sq4a TaxID=2878152 RepID=UPI0020BFC728|nr:hypothetical protein [Caballeronia sp. Sq4a]
MITKHTPGPWKAVRAPHGPIDVFDSGERDIVTVYGGGTNGDKEANARLIAAAPELLEFAELVLRGIESGHIKAKPFLDMNALVGESIPMRTIGDAAREAIAKATGT